MRIALLMLLSSLAFTAQANTLRFETTWLLLEGGQQEQTALHLDESRDLLIVQRDGVEQVYAPRQVVSFFYGGYEYYSLPLNGSYSFFRVLHEGNEFALLYKTAGNRLLEFFVNASKGAIQLCEDAGDPEKLLLCEGNIGPSFGMPAFSGSSVQYMVQDAMFLAVGGQLHLLSCRYDTKGQWLASVPSLQKKNKRILKRMKPLVQNEQKMLQLKHYVASSSTDLEDPDQLLEALQTLYH